jgi:hypothetical protein
MWKLAYGMHGLGDNGTLMATGRPSSVSLITELVVVFHT